MDVKDIMCMLVENSTMTWKNPTWAVRNHRVHPIICTIPQVLVIRARQND